MTKKKHSIVLLSVPNALTFMNMITGFAILLLAHRGHIVQAAWLLPFALVWDSLDGNIARILDNTSDFGRELDSLSDMVSFVVAPVFLAFVALEGSFKPLQFIFFAVYLAAGAARLARFNLGRRVKGYFEGLPTPAAAMAIAMFILSAHNNSWDNMTEFPIILELFILLLGVLMVSRVPYPKFSAIPLMKWKKYASLSGAFFLLTALIVNCETAMFLSLLNYIVLSPRFRFSREAVDAGQAAPVKSH